MIVLYGSQHGNSMNVAQEIYHILDNKYNKLLSLNDSLDLFKDDISSLSDDILIVISTTGNGDIPSNAEKWWRFIKNRKLDKNYLEKINFYLLALGDSNYDQFCGAGKKVYKRMKELNAVPLHDIITIDDVDSDYEEKIDYLINLIQNQ